MNISIFAGTFIIVAMATTRLWAFDTFEHRHLGNVAYEEVTKTMNSTDQIMKDLTKFFVVELNGQLNGSKRCDKVTSPSRCMAFKALQDVPIQFGDFAALAGDHAGTPAEMYQMVINFAQVLENNKEIDRILATRRQWHRACSEMRTHYRERELEYGTRCIIGDTNNDYLLSGNRNAVLPPTGYRPERDEWSEFESLTGFVNLVSSNKSHFPMHSWREYALHHFNALKAADYYSKNKSPDECMEQIGLFPFGTPELLKVPQKYAAAAKPTTSSNGEINTKSFCYLRKALIYEGFAQHFLHDSFSSGHIGTEFGSCKLKWVLCIPDKHVVNHTHNELNRLGLRVQFQSKLPEEFKSELQQGFKTTVLDSLTTKEIEEIINGDWLAAGDDFLMIPEAVLHRHIIISLASHSLREVLNALVNGMGTDTSLSTVCKKSALKFPIAATDPNKTRTPNCAATDNGEGFSEDEEDLAEFQADRPFLWPNFLWPDRGEVHRLLGRSTDERVRLYPLEGWKFMVTWGQAWGRFDELNANGTRQATENRSTTGTFEVGYVRKTEWWIPNYLGFGAAVITGVRTSIYPMSVGYWFASASRTITGGVRMNIGLRMDEAFMETNPSHRRVSSMELGFPLDIGLNVYKGVSFYIRPELLMMNFPGLAGSGPSGHIVGEHVFKGEGRVTFGLILDFSEIL